MTINLEVEIKLQKHLKSVCKPEKGGCSHHGTHHDFSNRLHIDPMALILHCRRMLVLLKKSRHNPMKPTFSWPLHISWLKTP